VAGQVLNMSHDLVPLGIATQNLTPDVSSQDARPLIQATLQYVQSHPVQVLTLDKGNYYLLTAQQPNATLLFPRLSNMTVDLAGSTIYFNGPLLPNGINVFQCTNFTLKNFQIDYINPPYTHVQITSVDPANRLLHYQMLQGWPDPSTFNTLTPPFGGEIEGLWAVLFRNGAIVPGTTRTLLTQPVAGNTLVLVQDGTPWTQSATLSTVLPGDIVVVAPRGGGPPILVWESDAVTLSNITVYGSPTWAIKIYATNNSTVDGVRVMPRLGSGLIGSNADGIHFASTRQNNHIRNSYVTRTLDDALVMDNFHAALVVNQTGPRQLRLTRNIYLRFPNGTAVHFVDPATTMEVGGATIVSQNPPDSDSPTFNGQVDLTFDRDLTSVAPGMGMVYGTPGMRGQGSTIEDSLVEDTFGGRGVWVSGVQGVAVQRNVIRRTSLAGIIVFQSTDPIDLPDLGPPSHDIIIRDNSLEAALGPAANGTGAQAALASIQVISTDNKQVGFASSASNTNISILNNNIADSGRSAIWVGELNGGTIANNLIGKYNQHPELGVWGISAQTLTQVVQDFASPIVIRYSSGVTNQNDGNVSTAVEYHHVSFDHYFITPVAVEIALLDAHAPPFEEWSRTGFTFKVYAAATAPVGSVDTCRFFNATFTPKSSHFYAPHGFGCEATLTLFPDWTLEDAALFSTMLPDANGTCTSGTIPVYRLYNNGSGGAPNHRFVTSLTERQNMLNKGYTPEGNGIGISMCVPP
jgi:hypothetical protein